MMKGNKYVLLIFESERARELAKINNRKKTTEKNWSTDLIFGLFSMLGRKNKPKISSLFFYQVFSFLEL